MTYQIHTVEELQALPFGSMVETAVRKHTKTSDADEWDFTLDSAQVLEEGEVMGFTSGSGVAKPKPKLTAEEALQQIADAGNEQPDPKTAELTEDKAREVLGNALGNIGDALLNQGKTPEQAIDFAALAQSSLPEEEILGAPDIQAMAGKPDTPEEAMAAFQEALKKKVGERMVGGSQFDDEHDHDHNECNHGPVVTHVVSVIDMSTSVVPVMSWAIPQEDVAQLIAAELGKILSQISDKTYYVATHPLLGFHTIPAIQIPGVENALGLDLGAMVELITADDPAAQAKIAEHREKFGAQHRADLAEQIQRAKQVLAKAEQEQAGWLDAEPDPGPDLDDGGWGSDGGLRG